MSAPSPGAAAAPAPTPAGAKFVALEGRDGVGKTVQIPRVAARLRDLLEVEVRETREPGATEVGAALREIVLNERSNGEQAHPLSERARLLLFAADNAQHASQVVQPALDAGPWVLSDRSLGSALAYQGFGFGFGVPTVRRLYTWALEGVIPHITVLLDCDDAVVAERLARDGQTDSIEKLPDAFHRRVRDGYRQLAAEDPTWITVDASGDIDEVTDLIVDAVHLGW